jgi:uncharacterized protein (TIGR02246 family)
MTHNAAVNEAEVRALIDGYANAIRNHDIDGVVAAYAQDLMAFDVVPPLQNVGVETYRKVWQQVFEMLEKPIPYEIRDLSVTASDDVAFSHSLNRNGGTMKNGRKLNLWLRWTACYRKIDGNWKITHMHASVPADLQTGKALTELTP